MSESNHSKLRVRGEDSERLQSLKDSEKVEQMALEAGLIEEGEKISYEHILSLAIPEDAEVISRSDMTWIRVGDEDVHEEVMELAGENVSAHEVVHRFTEQFIERHEIQVSNQ